MMDFFDMVKIGIQLGIGLCIGYEGLKLIAKSIYLCLEELTDWLIEKYFPEDDDECN